MLRLAFVEWATMYKKNKRALLRWKQQSEHHMVSMWKDFTLQERDWKRIETTIARARAVHFKWEVLVDWQFNVQTARYQRELLGECVLQFTTLTTLLRLFTIPLSLRLVEYKIVLFSWVK